jgi:hypothetical protein
VYCRFRFLQFYKYNKWVIIIGLMSYNIKMEAGPVRRCGDLTLVHANPTGDLVSPLDVPFQLGCTFKAD